MPITALRLIAALILTAVLAGIGVLLFATAAQAAGAQNGCSSLAAAYPWRVSANATLDGRQVAVRATRTHQPTTTVTARNSAGQVLATRSATGPARTISVPAGTKSAAVRVRWNVPAAADPVCSTTLRR